MVDQNDLDTELDDVAAADHAHSFEMEADDLRPDDWTSHRDLAQEAAQAGYGVSLIQTVFNDAAAPYPMVHDLRFVAKPEDLGDIGEGINEREDPMGGSEAIEYFTPERPHGFYGQRTPLEFSPVQDDWPDTANIRLSNGGKESVHSTLTQALETVLHEQSDLAWLPPKHHSGFDSDGPLRADNDSPLLLNADGSVAAEHVLDAFRAVADAEGQRITVATGREDIGSVVKAEFTPDGSWKLGSYNATNRNEVEGTGPIPSRQVTRELSDAFETQVEGSGRYFRAQEHRVFDEARGDAQGLASRLLTPTSGAGVEANAMRLAHAEEVVASYNRREDAAYAQAASSTQEPYVGPDPAMERLMVAHGGDVRAVVESEDFASTVEATLGMAPHEEFIADEDGERFETWMPSADDEAYVSSVVGLARQEVSEAVPALSKGTSSVSQQAARSVDGQALSSLEQVLKNRPPAGPKAGLRSSETQSGRAFTQAERLSPSKSQDHGLAGPPPF